MGSHKKLSENEILEQVHDHSGSEVDFSDYEGNEEIILYKMPSASSNFLENNEAELSENIDEEIIDEMFIENNDEIQSTSDCIQNYEFIENIPSTSGVKIIDYDMPSTSGIENIDHDMNSTSGVIDNSESSISSDSYRSQFRAPISSCIPTVIGRRARTRGGMQRGAGLPRRGRGVWMRGVTARGVRIRGQRARGRALRRPRGRGEPVRGRGGRAAPIDPVLLGQIDGRLIEI